MNLLFFLPQFVLVLSGDNEGLAIYLIPQTKHRGKPKENTVKGGKVLKGLAIQLIPPKKTRRKTVGKH